MPDFNAQMVGLRYLTDDTIRFVHRDVKGYTPDTDTLMCLRNTAHNAVGAIRTAWMNVNRPGWVVAANDPRVPPTTWCAPF